MRRRGSRYILPGVNKVLWRKVDLLKDIKVDSLLILLLLAGISAILFSGTGCMPDPYSVGQPDSLFSEFMLVWDLVDQHYACFCESVADWDQIYSEYKPLAVQVSNRDQLIEVILGMLGELQDIQLVLTNSSGERMESWDPGYSPNWDMEVWQAYMEEWGISTTMNTFGVSPLSAPIDSIGYIYISTLDNTFNWLVFFDSSSAIQQCSSLVIDLRMCSGSGFEYNATYTIGRFTSIATLAYYRAFRVGPDRSDMGEFLPVFSNKNGAWQFTRPTLVLTGRDTQGAGELLMLLLASQEHVTIIGDTTSGFGNVTQEYNLLENWTVSIPLMMTYTTDSVSLLRHGVAPEVYVQTTEADFQAGIDPVLDAALEMLL